MSKAKRPSSEIELDEVVTQLFLFREVYKRLSASGLCDDAGGAEYIRVTLAWMISGMPADMEGFIQWHANRGHARGSSADAERAGS